MGKRSSTKRKAPLYRVPADLYERLAAQAEIIRRETGQEISWRDLVRKALESAAK